MISDNLISDVYTHNVYSRVEWSQLGLGKHAHSLALITEALNLCYRRTHGHTKIQTEVQTHTLFPGNQSRAEVWATRQNGRGHFELLKIPTQKVKTRQASSYSKKRVREENKR